MQVQNILFTPQINNTRYYHTKLIPYDSVSFSGKNNDEQYERALDYAKRQKILNYLIGKDFSRYNLDKLEGIQHGIEIFDGLDMKEIAFVFDNLHSIAVKRGCSNQCLHCFVNAKPPQKEQDNYINKMSYEDFDALTSGIQTLRERIGASPVLNTTYISMFQDADCMEIALYDKNGVEHDMTDLFNKLYDATSKKMIFDTAGWNHKNPKMQERAEKYVKYLCDIDNEKKIHQVNLSINPFNFIYAKARKVGFNPQNYNPENENPTSSGEKLYSIYIDRMVNMLLTFAPLLNYPNFNIISRPTKKDDEYLQEFNTNAHKQNVDNILKRLAVVYSKNSSKTGNNSTKTSIDYYINEYHTLFEKGYDNELILSERLKKVYLEKNPEITQKEFDEYYPVAAQTKNIYESLKRTKNLTKLNFDHSKILDANGKLYLFDGYRYIPTEISLNLKNKDKTTPKLPDDGLDDFVITKEMINKKADT